MEADRLTEKRVGFAGFYSVRELELTRETRNSA
jgi:hypothetical protein